jgi:hypothetical protein
VSKKSRTFQPSTKSSATPADPGSEASTADTGAAADAGPATAASGSSTATSRSAARRRATSGSRVSAPPTFFERYRVLIVGAIAVVLVGVSVAVIANMSASTANAYECTTLLSPGPADPIPTPRPATSVAPGTSSAPGVGPVATATPEPQPTQRLGFTTQDLGRGHVTTSTKVTYDYCPPASGEHYNISGQAPLTRRFYPPSTKLGPVNWIHNLEHGYVVLLYRGEPAADVLQGLQDIMAEATPTAASGERCGYSKVIAVRSDDLGPGVNYAAIGWDRELLLDEFDKQALLTFANQWQDGPQTPEPGLC